VAALLDQGADRKESLPEGLTLLKAAVAGRRPDVVKLLLARGADVNERRGGTSALAVAAMDGDLAMVKLLLSAGARAAKQDSFWVRGPDQAEILALLKASEQAPAAAAPAGDAPAPASPRGEHDADFALIVGVGKYLDAPEARFAESDAAAVRDRLVALGWPARNVLLLTGERAGRAGLDRYLDRWLAANAGPNAEFFFYFAGDGAVDPKTGLAYLLPWDGDAAMLEQTGYPLARLCERLGALGRAGAGAVIDAGFSGAGARAAAAPGPRSASTEVFGNCDAILAAAGGQAAGVLDSLGRGALTDAFLSALDGAAKGPLTLRGAFESMRAAVSEGARGRGSAQTPIILSAPPGSPALRL
jgi:hypothetical protein